MSAIYEGRWIECSLLVVASDDRAGRIESDAARSAAVLSDDL